MQTRRLTRHDALTLADRLTEGPITRRDIHAARLEDERRGRRRDRARVVVR